MKTLMKTFVLGVIAALAIATGAQAVEVAGLKIDDTAQVGNTTLKLNGAGIRTKFVVVKVYVGALYLTENKTTTEAVLALAGPKKVNLTMLREISSDSFAQSFMDGVKRNTDKVERAKLTDQFIKFGELFATVEALKKGDMISIEWVPGTGPGDAGGSNMYVNGKKVGDTFKDIAFFNAILRIWLGDNPVDSSLKTKMLGGGDTAKH
jgi:hypothetical protein